MLSGCLCLRGGKMGRFGLAVSWCLRRVVALKRQQTKPVVAKGNWQAVKAIKKFFGDGPKRRRFRRPLLRHEFRRKCLNLPPPICGPVRVSTLALSSQAGF